MSAEQLGFVQKSQPTVSKFMCLGGETLLRFVFPDLCSRITFPSRSTKHYLQMELSIVTHAHTCEWGDIHHHHLSFSGQVKAELCGPSFCRSPSSEAESISTEENANKFKSVCSQDCLGAGSAVQWYQAAVPCPMLNDRNICFLFPRWNLHLLQRWLIITETKYN